MQYFITFLEGIITFISPCLLPMIPIYLLYFAGDTAIAGNSKKNYTLIRALAFCLGFTVVFIILGALSGFAGKFLLRYQIVINIITGAVVVIFGLNYTGLIKLNFLNKNSGSLNMKPFGFFSSVLFGIVFSISWTPCVGAFLGSALMLAAQRGSVFEGIVLLLLYSAGLAIPFIISAVAIEYLAGAFNFIKRHYRIINIVCGILLIIIGVLMATGFLGYVLTMIQ